MIKVHFLSLELVIHSTLRSGYFRFGNSHILLKLPIFKYVLQMFADCR